MDFEIFIAPIFKGIDMLLGLGDKFKKLRGDDKVKAAEYLLAVSQCIATIAAKMQLREWPYAECSELQRYGQDMPKPVAKVLGDKKAEVIDAISRGINARYLGLTATFAPNDDLTNAVTTLTKLAGLLKGLSVTLKVS